MQHSQLLALHEYTHAVHYACVQCCWTARWCEHGAAYIKYIIYVRALMHYDSAVHSVTIVCASEFINFPFNRWRQAATIALKIFQNQ